ncbi:MULTISPECIES: MFS transporter permease [Xanthomonas]|uniref:MFS transporter permease n=1 Tax=Xanthomonas rydalmerensis TaxID=3046274 RepID=A0ABZ0JT20_9XANT|nr:MULTISPECIES: MFS transporter permease [unclassified Xanthomonas]WOS42134.1 MFS transporter permease [Xanthomonas sp. DM-2023]WOS46320.1 MFS transporter permease [Xanthomonas sp. DM-2023]WOS50499.1 MFS transporter permease [Xanthomonas sp. DM-2023]WOS54679.1 MFS transporter permease [Xanthomonas sp. DM-2023]WOS58862.1 MFS transporter permease [Xanthomonas sp. DM-2023]
MSPIDPLSTLFAPSATKSALLCATSFGWYALYWFYRNWRALRLLSGRRWVSPVWRSVFSLLWVFACFRGLERTIGAQRGALVGWLGPALAYVCLSLLGAWPSALSLLTLLSWTPVLLVNQRLVRFKQSHGLPRNPAERFNAWTWTWLAIAGPVALLVMVGMVVAIAGVQHHIKVDLPTR